MEIIKECKAVRISPTKFISLLFLVLSVFYLYTAYNIQVFAFDENAPFNARTFPIYLGWAGIILSSLKIILPEKVTYEDLQLKRGIVKKNSDIGKWCNSFLTEEKYLYFVSRKTLNVFLLDNNSDKILMTWTFYNCYPIEINIDPFDAMNGAYAIETMKLTYSHFKKT